MRLNRLLNTSVVGPVIHRQGVEVLIRSSQVLSAPLPAMTTPLTVSSSPDHSRSQPLSRSQSPVLSASSHEFACQPSLSHEERFLEMFPTTCLQASTSPPASFTPRYLSHSLQPLDLIDRCQPPVLYLKNIDERREKYIYLENTTIILVGTD